MESVPKNQDVEQSLQEDHIKGTYNKRERAKKVLDHLKSIFTSSSWPDDVLAVRTIEHIFDKLRTLKSKKMVADLDSLRAKPFFSISSSPSDVVPLDEAPPRTSPVKSVVKKSAGRPMKRLSDGTCKKTSNKIIDDIVDSIAETSKCHRIDPLLLLSMVS